MDGCSIAVRGLGSPPERSNLKKKKKVTGMLQWASRLQEDASSVPKLSFSQL